MEKHPIVAIIKMPDKPTDYHHGENFMDKVVSAYGEVIGAGDHTILDFRGSDMSGTDADFMRALADMLDENDDMQWSVVPRSDLTKYLVTACNVLVTILEEDDPILFAFEKQGQHKCEKSVLMIANDVEHNR